MSTEAKLEEAQTHHRAGRLGEAESLYRAVLEDDPDAPDALHLLGLLAGQVGNGLAGEKLIRKSIFLDPKTPNAHLDLGNLLVAQGDGVGAEAAYRAALDLEPHNRAAGLNLATRLRAQYDFDQSVNILTQLIEKHENDPDILNELGQGLRGLGDLEGAIAAYGKAVTLRGDFAGAHWNLCVALMLMGDYEKGLAQWGWRAAGSEAGPSPFPHPQWDGARLPGGTLLIHGEQGIGDQILCSGFIESAAQGKAGILVECDARLAPLLDRSLPGCEVIGMSDPPPDRCMAQDVTHQISMIDLAPLVDPFPGSRRTLKADPDRTREFRQWLKTLGGGPFIGISWRSANVRTGSRKSLPLEQWDPILAAREAIFVNLQYGETEEELARAPANIHTPPGLDRHDDLEGLAALIAALDLVISTSNLTVHFAGALGVDCWVMLNSTPLWYWGASAESAPFYPSLRLFRQLNVGEWGKVIGEVSGQLGQELGDG